MGFDPRRLDVVARQAGDRAVEIERLRRLPGDLVDELTRTGVFKLLVPTTYGGSQAHVADAVRAIESVAYHDGSTGWCVMIGITTGLCAGFMPPDHAAAVFGVPDAIAGGYGMPAGTGVAVAGGLRVSGRWSWGSGTDHCTAIGGGILVVGEDGRPASMEDGTRAPFVFFDRGDVELLDTWHVIGLTGTASTDYTVTKAFVPHGRWAEFLRPGGPMIDHPLYRFSFLGALGVGVAAVLLGLGRRAVDEIVELGAKRPAGSSRSLSERSPVQAEIARADAAVRSARTFLIDTVERCWESAERGDAMSDEHKRLLRLAATDAASRSAEAVDRCYHAGGGTSIFESSPLQRVFRDAHVATQHGMIAPRTYEVFGRMAFGLDTDTRQL